MAWFKKGQTYHFNSETRINIHSLPFYVGIIGVILVTLMYGFIYLMDGILPTPLMVSDESQNRQSFIAERASWYLSNLTRIGPRVTGSYENEAIAVDYLTRTIDIIMQESDSNQFLEKDIQEVTGSYYLQPQKGVINSYSNVKNIIVKLSGKEGSVSVLLNSHYDSVPTSPGNKHGASDDGINVAVMLEILGLLSKAETRPLHNIVFLFNGAEETPVQASHGFITQHKWAKSCKAVINLEAIGSGGKSILFQTGPQTPWLVKYYSGVPHPYGQVAGEELFQSGILPSDTDFRIFRDFGDLVGLDMAFIRNGYRYHTKFDQFSYIPLGSYQHVGDNALHLTKALSNAPEMFEEVPSDGKSVYYDIFGLFMIFYTNFIAGFVNGVIILISVLVFVYSMYSFKLGWSKSTLKFVGITTGAILASWILCIIFCLVFGVIIDLLGKTMSWYTNPWMAYGLYVTPCFGLSGFFLLLTNHENISLNIRCQIQVHLVRLIWTVILAFGLFLNIRAVYALMIPVLFSSLAFLVILSLNLQYSVKMWQIVYVSFMIFPSLNLMYQSVITFSLFIPMSGMIGSSINPDLIIGVIIVMFSLLILSPLTCMLNSLRNVRYFFTFLSLIFAAFLVIMFTPLGFPYSGNVSHPTPQRQWILHTARKFHNESGNLVRQDSGFFFLNMDRNSPRILKKDVNILNKITSIQDDCAQYAACAMPLSHFRMLQIVKYSSWIPAGQPILPDPITFDFFSDNVAKTQLLYNVSIKGPDRLSIYLVPNENMTLLNISLANKVLTSQSTFQGRPMYFINHQVANGDKGLNFTFNIRIPENWKGPTMNVTVIGRYVHSNQLKKTPQFVDLLDTMPDWTDVVAWLGAAYVYVV